jgi:hypothetical protein
VGLTPAWREALERARERDGELEDAKLQREKHERQKEVFRQWRKFGIEADLTPELPGKEKVRHLFGNMEQRDEAARLEQQRSKVGTTVETFIHDTLAQMGKIRMGLLRDLWRDKGGDPSHVLSGIRGLGCKLERLPQHDNELFVFPRAMKEAERESAATVMEIPAREKPAEVDSTMMEPLPDPPLAAESTIVERSTNPPQSLPKVDGAFVHGPLCDCFLCEDDSEPSYARPIGGRASGP